MAATRNLQILAYGTFYDVPRGLYVKIGNQVVHLLCRFDDDKDDYLDYYDVHQVPGATTDDFYTGAFYHRRYATEFLGHVNLSEIQFDASRRKSIRSAKLEDLVECGLSPGRV